MKNIESMTPKIQLRAYSKKEVAVLYEVSVKTLRTWLIKERVALRVKKGGHDVPPDKIESRYYRSLELLFDAAQISYQTFFFDNSGKDKKPILFANFKKLSKKKLWHIKRKQVPDWFFTYYVNKIKRK